MSFLTAIDLWNCLSEETIWAKTPQSFRSSVEAWLQGNQAHWTPWSSLSSVDNTWSLISLPSSHLPPLPPPPITPSHSHSSLGSESHYVAQIVHPSFGQQPCWSWRICCCCYLGLSMPAVIETLALQEALTAFGSLGITRASGELVLPMSTSKKSQKVSRIVWARTVLSALCSIIYYDYYCCCCCFYHHHQEHFCYSHNSTVWALLTNDVLNPSFVRSWYSCKIYRKLFDIKLDQVSI